MTEKMSHELVWLTLTLLMTSLYWLPYIVNRMLEQGILNALWDPFGDTHTDKAWANRTMSAHTNAVENLIIFAPLVILIQITGLNSVITETACMIYFYTRLIHYFSYVLALPILRVVTFLIGFGVQVILAVILLEKV